MALPVSYNIITAELSAAFARARLLRFHGWTFERAVAVPVLRWALEKSALAARRTHALPVQSRLI